METLAASDALTHAAASAQRDRGLAGLKSEDFFKILVSELQSQDPLQPAETSDMINQVSQIRSIELSGTLNDTLDTFARQQRSSGIAEFLGKYVTAARQMPDGSTEPIAGLVTGVRIADDGSAVLELDTGESVRMSEIVHVTTLEQADAQKTAAQAPGNAAPAEAPSEPDGSGAEATAKQQNQSRGKDAPPWPSWLTLDWKLG
jgi:flagellar basal-body rod modification protein FlgD